MPPESPRILVLGPADEALPIAAYLQQMLSADPLYVNPLVEGRETPVTNPYSVGVSLMDYFYQPDDRDQRLSWSTEPWSYVVMLEDRQVAMYTPEIYFEGVRVLGCLARSLGARPVVMMSLDCRAAPGASADAMALGEPAYRAGNGTDSVVVPAGYAREAIESPEGSAAFPLPVRTCASPDLLAAAASVYSAFTDRDAAATGYRPSDVAADVAVAITAVVKNTVNTEAERVHYQGPFRGVVELRSLPVGGDLWFMDAGSSSEHIWHDRMNEILTAADVAAHGTEIGYTNATKSFDAASLDDAVPYFQQQQYAILLARSYSIGAAQIVNAGAQSELQVQVWDRHGDADDSAGLLAVEALEPYFNGVHNQAVSWGVAAIPYHLMFAKLKTMRPSVSLLSDGTHATYPVGYGLATMSVVSRTGLHLGTEGLDDDTALATRLAEETIRQLSSLSVTGDPIPDDPSSRPSLP